MELCKPHISCFAKRIIFLIPAASPASGRLRIYLSVVVLRLTENILFVMRIEKKAFALQYLTESHYILGQPQDTDR